MRFEDLFLYDGMMHVFAFNYDIGPKRLTFQLQLFDHRQKRHASFLEWLKANGLNCICRGSPTIYFGGKFREHIRQKTSC